MKRSTTLLKKALKIAEEITFEKAIEGKKFKNPETGNDVQFSSLPADEQKKVRAEFDKKKKELDSQGGKGKGSLKSKEESQRLLSDYDEDLSNTDFSGEKFEDEFPGYSFEGASFEGGVVSAIFDHCNLRGANFRGPLLTEL